MSAVDGNDGLSRAIRYVEGEVPFEPGRYDRAYLGRRIAARMRRRSAANRLEVNERRLRVTASDNSEGAFAAARAGVYAITRTTDIGEEPGPLSAYGPYVEEEEDNVFRVRDSVKERVTFEPVAKRSRIHRHAG